MPPKKPKPPTTPRCAYKEGGQRCIKNATVTAGGISLCGVHARVVTQAAAAPPTGVRATVQNLGDIAADVLDDVFAGRKVNKEKIATAINDFAWGLGGAYAGYHPPVEDVPIGDPGASSGPGGQQRRRNPFTDWARPNVDPEAAHKAATLKKARATLGFGPAEAITPELLKARHRALSKKHHPDRGGSLERMQQINAAVDIVAASL